MENHFIPRKSFIALGNIYFWTATINSWHKLMQKNSYKQVIVDSLYYLSVKGKVNVYAFVIMPNHIHLIWQTNELNGKESAQGSLLKFTAHEFKKRLLKDNPSYLKLFAIQAHNKLYEFWQRDSLAIHLYTRQVAFQKLQYLHNNPLAAHWQLSDNPEGYYYSSARFYETGKDDFGFLKHIADVL